MENNFVRSYQIESDIDLGLIVVAGSDEKNVKTAASGKFIGVYSFQNGKVNKKQGDHIGVTIIGVVKVLVSESVSPGDEAVLDGDNIGQAKKIPDDVAGTYEIIGRFLESGQNGEYVDMLIEHYEKTIPYDTFTVSFSVDGGSEVPSQTVTSGNTAIEPASPTKATFTFAGWYADSELTTEFNFTTPITSDTTIYAKWTSS